MVPGKGSQMLQEFPKEAKRGELTHIKYGGESLVDFSG